MMAEQHVSATEYANREAVFGTVPLLKNQRVYSLVDLMLVAGSFAIATWCYTQGAAIASIVSMPQGFIQVFAAILAFTPLTALIGAMSNRYGIDHFIIARSVWGFNGAFIIMPLAMMVVMGFLVVNVDIYSNSFTNLLSRAGAEGATAPWAFKLIGITCPILGAVIALIGPTAVRWATRVMGISLVAIGILVIILVFVRTDANALWSALPLSGQAADRTTYMLGVEWNVAFALSWYPCIGAITRLGRSERGGFWGLWLGYGLLMAAYIFIGIAVSFAAASLGASPDGDPTTYLLEIGGPALGTLALILVGIANISTAAVGVYSMGISTKLLWPSWNYRWVVIFWTAVMVVFVIWGGIMNYYGTFLGYIGLVCGPGIALLVVDYWVLRRGKLDVHSLFRPGKKTSYRYTGGFNIPAWVAFACAAVAYLVVYDPIAYAPRGGMEGIFNIFTASGLAVIVAAVVYAALAMIPPIRRYLRADADAEKTC